MSDDCCQYSDPSGVGKGRRDNDKMGWNDRFQGMPWLRRFVALLALAVLVLGALSTPAIPDLTERASSQVDDVLLSEDDPRAEPVTRPAQGPIGRQGTTLLPLAGTLSEPARGFPPIKPAIPASYVGRLFEGTASAAVLPSPRLDQVLPRHESALGSARTPTGPPSADRLTRIA